MLPELPSATAFELALREHTLRGIRDDLDTIARDLAGLCRSGGTWYGSAVDALRERLDEDRRSLLLAADDLGPLIAMMRDWSRS